MSVEIFYHGEKVSLNDKQFMELIRIEYPDGHRDKELSQNMVVLALNGGCFETAKYIVKLLDDKKINIYQDLTKFLELTRGLLLNPITKDMAYDAIVKGVNVTAKEIFLNVPNCDVEKLSKLLGKHRLENASDLSSRKVKSNVMDVMSRLLGK